MAKIKKWMRNRLREWLGISDGLEKICQSNEIWNETVMILCNDVRRLEGDLRKLSNKVSEFQSYVREETKSRERVIKQLELKIDGQLNVVYQWIDQLAQTR